MKGSRIESALEEATGQPVGQYLRSLSGLSVKDIALRISDQISEPVVPIREISEEQVGNHQITDPDIDFESVRVLPGDLLCAGREKYKIRQIFPHKVRIDQPLTRQSRQRLIEDGYQIRRPWKVSRWAVKCMCERHDIFTTRGTHARARHQGRHQQAIEKMYGLPFAKFVDKTLFGGLGIRFDGGRMDPMDPLEVARDLPGTIFLGNSRAANNRRKNMRMTVLKALVQRSPELSLGFHLRPDLPDFLTQPPLDD